jgi:GT2 family glycosyltransferase
MMSHPSVSVIITAYNAADDLPSCLYHLIRQDYPSFEIIVVDNASIDRTPQIINRYKDFVLNLRLEKNRAVAGGYNAGAEVAKGEYLVFINADTIPQPGWLSGLIEPMLKDESIGMTTSRILLEKTPHLINTCGNDITWTGLTVCRGMGDRAEMWQEAGEVSAVSGASCAIRRDLFLKIGGFDETFEFYLDDTDLSLRAQLAGYRIWYAPASRILHRYSFNFNANKAFFQERNRWLTVIKLLRTRTLLILLPGLIFGDLIAWVYSFMKGSEHVHAKARSWAWLWQNRQKIREMQWKTQAYRKVNDLQLLKNWSPQLRFTGTVSARQARLLENITKPLLRGYGAVTRILVDLVNRKPSGTT